MLHTASFFGLADFKGEAVSVSNSSPEWFEGKCLKSFNPPWSIVKEFKDGTIDWEQFSNAYIGYLENTDVSEDMKYISDILEEKKDITLLCWERIAGRCHRMLLVEWLSKKMGVDIAIDNIR